MNFLKYLADMKPSTRYIWTLKSEVCCLIVKDYSLNIWHGLMLYNAAV